MKFLLFVFAVCFLTLTSSAQELEWEKIDVPIHSPVSDICFTPSGEIYAGSYGIYRSDDDGQNWEADIEPFSGDIFLGKNHLTPYFNNIFQSSRGYLFATYSYSFTYRKAPGSTEWELQYLYDYLSFQNISESSTGRLYCDDKQYKNNLNYSDDNDDTWVAIPIEPKFDSFTITSDDKIILATTDKELLIYEESADTLLIVDTVAYELPDNSDGYLSKIYEINDIFIGGDFKSEYKDSYYFSKDIGKTWVRINEISGYEYITNILPGDNKSILIFTEDDGIYQVKPSTALNTMWVMKSIHI